MVKVVRHIINAVSYFSSFVALGEGVVSQPSSHSIGHGEDAGISRCEFYT